MARSMKQRSLFDELKDEIQRRELEAAKKTTRSSVTLRPYQTEAVDAVYREWESNRATLVCLPTGTGKSIVFSEVMRRWSDR